VSAVRLVRESSLNGLLNRQTAIKHVTGCNVCSLEQWYDVITLWSSEMNYKPAPDDDDDDDDDELRRQRIASSYNSCFWNCFSTTATRPCNAMNQINSVHSIVLSQCSVIYVIATVSAKDRKTMLIFPLRSQDCLKLRQERSFRRHLKVDLFHYNSKHLINNCNATVMRLVLNILYRTEFVQFCLNLVDMVTPLAPLKFIIANLKSPTR